MTDLDHKRCLCGSGLDYSQCCAPYHTGDKNAGTAEILMRSRFTAYALRDSTYLLATWDVSKRPDNIDFSKERAEWQSLEIIDCKKGGPADSKGLVEFKAYYRLDGEEHVLHELSRFKKSGGRWFYLDGQIKAAGPVGQPLNQGRNAPCPCGSGKKFKRCCGL